MTYVDYAKKLLKERRCRLTTTRISLLENLSVIKEPMNAYGLAKKIQESGEKIDTVTIYRILSVLEKLKLVHKVANGYMPCQDFTCNNKKHCHHHFICSQCGDVTEVHLDDESFLQGIKKKFSSLLINSHNFEFSGLCTKCKK